MSKQDFELEKRLKELGSEFRSEVATGSVDRLRKNAVQRALVEFDDPSRAWLLSLLSGRWSLVSATCLLIIMFLGLRFIQGIPSPGREQEIDAQNVALFEDTELLDSFDEEYSFMSAAITSAFTAEVHDMLASITIVDEEEIFPSYVPLSFSYDDIDTMEDDDNEYVETL